jgi:pimeloyl-ACP methyl ester carboxylesterase
LKVHFVHERARLGKEGEGNGGRKVVPLLMVHGWPGTWFEFQNVMGPLLKGEGKGKGEGEGEESGKGPVFDLVVPSLPGFDTLMKRLGVCVPSSFLAYIR